MSPTVKRPPNLRNLSAQQKLALQATGGDVLAYFPHVAQHYGDVVDISSDNWQSYLLSNPEHIEHVHVQTGRIFDKGYGGDPMLDALFGNGIIVSEREFWLRQRRMIQPAFHRERIAGYAEVMTAYALRMVQGWEPGQTRDVHEDMMAVTLEIILKTLFDTELGDQTAAMGRIMDGVLGGMAEMQTQDPAAFARGQGRFGESIAGLNAFTARVIAERKNNPRDTGDLLSMLLATRDDDGTGMDDQQVLDECKNLIMAGHETTSNTLTWTWLLLSQNPQAEAKLQAELEAVLGGRAPTMADLGRLQYTNWVIKEAMRIYPPVFGVSRVAARDTEIGGYFVPAGMTLQMSQWVVHRDPRWFTEPLEFRPERWADDLERRIPKYAYFPFGGGARMCIGNSFALMEAPLILATVAQKFRLEVLPQEVVLEPSITLRPQHGLKVRLQRR